MSNQEQYINECIEKLTEEDMIEICNGLFTINKCIEELKKEEDNILPTDLENIVMDYKQDLEITEKYNKCIEELKSYKTKYCDTSGGYGLVFSTKHFDTNIYEEPNYNMYEEPEYVVSVYINIVNDSYIVPKDWNKSIKQYVKKLVTDIYKDTCEYNEMVILGERSKMIIEEMKECKGNLLKSKMLECELRKIFKEMKSLTKDIKIFVDTIRDL